MSAASSTRAAACRSTCASRGRTSSTWTAPATCSTTRRPTAWRSSTRPAAAPRATCGGRTWCPASIPYIKSGGLLFLNPAAFATPMPGTFGNLKRNSIHGPGFQQVDLVASSGSRSAGPRNVEFRAEIFNVFNRDELHEPGRHAAERAAGQQPDRGQQGAAGPGLLVGGSRDVRHDDEHGRADGRPRHQPAGAVRGAGEFLRNGLITRVRRTVLAA